MVKILVMANKWLANFESATHEHVFRGIWRNKLVGLHTQEYQPWD